MVVHVLFSVKFDVFNCWSFNVILNIMQVCVIGTDGLAIYRDRLYPRIPRND
jgi:hypothetical protein